jgi:D-alanyl-lipoteichoic acid acyltransferase DltB (MBOAT superfamily)
VLFNSYTFLFVFLPATLAVFALARLRAPDLALSALTLASLAFYGYWDPRFLALLLGSAAMNFGFGRLLETLAPGRRRAALAAGVTANLALLGWFKYAGFLTANLAALGAPTPMLSIALPIGISFFTFQQIAYLVDVARGVSDRYGPRDYLLFVAFFPQLIAGPIVHHREMMPQLRAAEGPQARDVAIGLSLFAAGLFKKVALADSFAPFASPVFAAADAGLAVTAAEAWGAALAYALQLYFDFSGYSDMALGLARLFGVRLPLNFDSPYQATSIIDFWRRWHITLSRFLRDYLYVPLGGNRRGPLRRHVNLMITMVLGGFWHGAGWGFVIWGAIHGACLVINHLWRRIAPRTGLGPATANPWVGRLLTFAVVVVALVFFRATTLGGALTMLSAMVGASAEGAVLHVDAESWRQGALAIAGGLALCWFAPTVNDLLLRDDPWYGGERAAPSVLEAAAAGGPGRRLVWRPSLIWLAPFAAMFAVSALMASSISEFLYFQF